MWDRKVLNNEVSQTLFCPHFPSLLLSPPRRQIWNILLLCVKGQVKRRKPSWLVLLGYRWACVTNRCCPGLFPSLHLLLLLLMCVCLIVPARGSPLFPLTSWPLLPVRCVNAAFNQFYCLTHTRRYSWPYPSLLCRARFIKISPHPITHPDISNSQTSREHGHVALSSTLYYWGCLPVFVS